MADGTTTYGVVNQRTAAWAATDMLRHAETVAVLAKLGMTKEMPRNKADTVKFRRAVPFAAATIPLVEGVTPTAQKMAYEDVPVQMRQYGRPIEITDVVQDLAEDAVLADATQLAGEQAGLTLEMIIYAAVKAGTNVFYTNGSVRTSVNTAITLNKQRAVTRGLKAQKAAKMRSILGSSPNYGTQAIEAAYIAVGHTDCEADIRGLASFIPTASYGQRQVLSEYEIGAVEDCRYILSPELSSWADGGGDKGSMVSTSGTKADVYPIIYFGREAFATVPLKGKRAITPMVLNPNTPRGGDPLGQRGTVSWKAYMAALITNENWMARLETAVTDL